MLPIMHTIIKLLTGYFLRMVILLGKVCIDCRCIGYISILLSLLHGELYSTVCNFCMKD